MQTAGGIGLTTTKALAAEGAAVVMACRKLHKADAAAAIICQELSAVKLRVMHLADLESVRAFAEAFGRTFEKLELLVNNAGVMVPPFTKTKDGFKVQFGANHLSHFALTGLLLDRLQASLGARVVNVSSSAHRMGRLDLSNLHAERGYRA